MANQIGSVLSEFFAAYSKRTPHRLKLIDLYLVYIMLTGIIQFAYVVMVGTFPFNSFLSGFISTVANFVLTVSLRMQVNPDNKFSGITPERAFADYVFCQAILHLAVINFMG